MKNIRITSFDTDGTLTDMNTKVITRKMEGTLIRLKQNHVILCVVTGWPLRDVLRLPGTEFGVFPTFNVSYCYIKDEVILKNPIPLPDAHTIIGNTKGINRLVCAAGADRLGTNGRDKDSAGYLVIANQTVEIVDDFEELAREDIHQMMIGCYPEEYDKIPDHAKGAKITAWWNRTADIISTDGGKGPGAERILNYCHLMGKEATTFGDGTNDIEILQAVSHGVAMGSTTDNTKEVVDDIYGCTAEDGICDYRKKMYLI